ncbi:glucosaminidase domain-containing protein [Enterococcus hermanniensis]|nr:glucosaminidase domain-containing protein [Enterococcus hermanniensis]
MKYNKIVSLMAIGTLFGPTLLSSQQVLAEETSTVGSSAVAPTSTTESDLNLENTDTPSQQESEVNLIVNGSPLPSKNTFEYEGNKIHFTISENQVSFTTELVANYELKNLSVKNDSEESIVVQSNNSFDVSKGNFYLTVEFKKVNESTDTSDSNSSESSTTESSSSNNSNDNGSSNSSSGSSSSTNSGTGTNGSSSTNNNSNNNAGSSTTGSSSNTSNNNNTNNNKQNTTKTPEVQGPSAARQPVNDSSATDVRVPSNQNVPTFSNDVQTAIVQEAYRHLGKPYVWGAKGPNAFDCSGLAYLVYANATGHNIGGWTGDQQYAGTQIPVSEAQPGDLLFWGAPTSVTTHVAIYIGNGQYIHAPQPGDVVKIGNISDFTPTFAVRVNVAGLSQATASSSLSNAFGEYSTDTPFIFNKNQTTDQFIKKIGETAREIGQKNNVYSSVMIAQAILESGSGNSSLASEPNYNLFGIKGKYQGKGITFQTLEQDEDGANYQISAEFRKYPSYKESLEDYAKLIKNGISGNSDFYKDAWKNQTSSYEEATKHLQGRYATDKQYAEKLNAIIKAYDLTEFDQAKNSSATTLKATKGPVIKSMETSFDSYDRIQAKLIASVITSYQIPQVMSAKHFFNLFRGDSLIALAATATPKISNSESPLPKTASIYVALGNGLLAVIPPLK